MISEPLIAVLVGSLVWPSLMFLGVIPRWTIGEARKLSPGVLAAVFWIVEVGIGGAGLKLAQGKGPLIAILIFAAWCAGLCFPLWITRCRMAANLAKLLGDDKKA